jgi:hypothetical protein
MRVLRALLVCALLLPRLAHAFHPHDVDHEADLLCHVCNASYYCLDGQQFDCPVNSLAAVALADSISECVCNPGYLREGDLCNLGAPPAWYMFGNRSFCVHTRETIAAGASSHADCVCVPGFAGLPAAEPVHCEACPADTFTDVHNASECVPCPAHASHNETLRANVTACLCDPGYTGPDGGPCVACAAGTFKAEPGAAACEGCGVNEYSYAAAAVCVACNANSTSLPRSPGVDHCLCDSGFYPLDDLCSMCHAGRFKNTTKNEPCKPCTGNTFASTVGATACTSCLVSSPFSTANPSEGGVRCQCITGYTQTELNLTTPACSACAADTYQPSQGQTTCQLCDPSARSPEASVTPLACLCNAGFADDSAHECLVCAGGTYKEAAADDEEDTEPCDVCPEDSFSLPQSGRLADCLCDPGFSGPDGGPCVACAPGKFKAANGSAACQDCPLHTYSDAAASTSCKSCTQFLDFWGITLAPGQDSSNDCECDVSQGFSAVYVNGARKCTGCKAGTYASAEGCRNCSNGTFNNEDAQTTCKLCPVNASSYDYPHVSCQCHKGFFCQQQPQITHDYTKSFNSYNDGGLKFTVINGIDRLLFAYDTLVTTSLQHKEMNAFFSTYYGLVFVEYWGKTFAGQLPECLPSMTLIPCQKIMSSISFFSTTQKILNAFRVYIFKWFVYQNNGAGQYYWFQCASFYEAYTQCALFDGEFTSIGNSGASGGSPVSLNAILSFRSIHLQDPRTCADGLCAACTMDTFKNYTGGAGSCVDCQAYSQSIPASTSQDMCLCKRGYRQAGPHVCVACAAGTYSDALDVLACSVCPAETYTPSARAPWDTPSDCQACDVCNQATNPTFTDHYDAARAGLGCGLDQPSSCQACPAAASLFLPTTESNRNKGVTSCVCDRHFYGVIGAACAACPSNQVRPDFINAATTLADCLCAPGFEPDPAAVNLCRQCPIGKFKPFAGDHNCTACPATLTTEQTGNANASACVCAPGFVFDGDECNMCPDNLYKIGFNLIQTCTACTANSVGDEGGTGPMDCSCLPGFIPSANICKICPPGTYNNETLNIGDVMIANDLANPPINLARACSGGNCPTSSSSVWGGWPSSKLVDGILFSWDGTFITNAEAQAWAVIDLEQTMFVTLVQIYNNEPCCQERLDNFQIRIGDSSTFSNNPACVSNQPWFVGYRDFSCVYSGRYVSLQKFSSNHLMVQEIEIYGRKSLDQFNRKCLVCPSNTATNNTGTLVCAACAAGKTTDGRTGQVECVCDVGTEPGTEPGAAATCQTCRAGRFKATSTDKYANRECVACGACGANNQVATECNSTHNITCRACQANSWASAGRTRLDPCFCNAGYELQGSLCVACPVGKARQANANNSICCEVCGTGFAITSAQATCQACSEICSAQACDEQIHDFSKIQNNLQSWQNYVTSIGATSYLNGYGWSGGVEGVYVVGGNPEHTGFIQLILPMQYNHVTVNYNNAWPYPSVITLYVNDVLVQSCPSLESREYSQTYTSVTIIKIAEQAAVIGKNLKITIRRCHETYVNLRCRKRGRRGRGVCAQVSLRAQPDSRARQLRGPRALRSGRCGGGARARRRGMVVSLAPRLARLRRLYKTRMAGGCTAETECTAEGGSAAEFQRTGRTARTARAASTRRTRSCWAARCWRLSRAGWRGGCARSAWRCLSATGATGAGSSSSGTSVTRTSSAQDTRHALVGRATLARSAACRSTVAILMVILMLSIELSTEIPVRTLNTLNKNNYTEFSLCLLEIKKENIVLDREHITDVHSRWPHPQCTPKECLSTLRNVRRGRWMRCSVCLVNRMRCTSVL